jgi:hypothetical protein
MALISFPSHIPQAAKSPHPTSSPTVVGLLLLLPGEQNLGLMTLQPDLDVFTPDDFAVRICF